MANGYNGLTAHFLHSYDFHGKLRRAFESKLDIFARSNKIRLAFLGNRHLTDHTEIEKAFALGEYIKRGAFPFASSFKIGS